MNIRISFLLLAIIASVLFTTACGGEQPSEATTSAEVVAPKVDAVTGYIDPACKMKVAEDASITHTHEGVTYGFCGEGCKSAFVADPATFLAALEE